MKYYGVTQIYQLILIVCALILTACETSPPKKEPPPPLPAQKLASIPSPQYHENLAEAMTFVAKSLDAQVLTSRFKSAQLIPVSSFFNEHSAEESIDSRKLQKELIASLSAAIPTGNFSSLTEDSQKKAQWAVLASFGSVKAEDQKTAGQWMRLKFALVEVKTGAIIARVVTHVNASKFNADSSAFYKNTPMYLTDKAHQDRNAVLSGIQTPLEESLSLTATFMAASEAYGSDKYYDAEPKFLQVLAIDPNNIGALSGLYQTQWRSGKKTEAEKTFSRLSQAAIDAGSLSVKLLFKVNSTDFVDVGDLSNQYQIWLKVIAQSVVENKKCLDVIGHASATGAADVNQRLSQARARRIATRMQQFVPAAKPNTFLSQGKGSTQMIVGTGADDASDSIDRRVEFTPRSCS